MGVGAGIELRVKNQSAVIANIYAFDRRAQVGMRNACLRAGAFCKHAARQLVHVDTGRTYNAIDTSYGDAGLSFQTFVDVEPFVRDGVDYYPPYEEFGTRFRPAHPFLFPAFRLTEPVLKAAVAGEIRAALAASARGSK